MEKNLENKLRLAIKNRGGIALKLTCPGFNGIPDRLILMPGGNFTFVELKFAKGRLSARQLAVHRLLEGLGFKVYVVRDNESLKNYLADINIL